MIIDGKLAETVGNHPGLIMWHVSNEFGGECFCDKCKAKFREYLRERFHNNIDELNHGWWTTFWSARYSDYLSVEIDAIREHSGNAKVPITTNFMERYYGIDYRVLAKKLDA